MIDDRRPNPRYETVHGELLVTGSFPLAHAGPIGTLLVTLHRYLEREPVGQVLMSPSEICFGPDTLVQPDVFVYRVPRAGMLEWSDITEFLLIAEIVTHQTSRADRFVKRRLYQEQGVPMYWAIDLKGRFAEVWMPGDPFPRIERETLVWAPTGASAPLHVTLQELFRPM